MESVTRPDQVSEWRPAESDWSEWRPAERPDRRLPIAILDYHRRPPLSRGSALAPPTAVCIRTTTAAIGADAAAAIGATGIPAEDPAPYSFASCPRRSVEAGSNSTPIPLDALPNEGSPPIEGFGPPEAIAPPPPVPPPPPPTPAACCSDLRGSARVAGCRIELGFAVRCCSAAPARPRACRRGCRCPSAPLRARRGARALVATHVAHRRRVRLPGRARGLQGVDGAVGVVDGDLATLDHRLLLGAGELQPVHVLASQRRRQTHPVSKPRLSLPLCTPPPS